MKRKWLAGQKTPQLRESGLDVFCFPQFATITIILGLKGQREYGGDKDKWMNKLVQNVCKKKAQCDSLYMFLTGEA